MITETAAPVYSSNVVFMVSSFIIGFMALLPTQYKGDSPSDSGSFL